MLARNSLAYHLLSVGFDVPRFAMQHIAICATTLVADEGKSLSPA